MAAEEEVVFDTRYDEEDDLKSESGSVGHHDKYEGKGEERQVREVIGIAQRSDDRLNEDNISEAGQEDDK